MQQFKIVISRDVTLAQLESAWSVEEMFDSPPKTAFLVDGRELIATVYTGDSTPWPAGDFRKTIIRMLHRIHPDCEIADFNEVGRAAGAAPR